MSSFECRLQRITEILGTSRPVCPTCHNEPVSIVVYDGLEWGDDPEVQGERCPECSSPDARTYRILYDDKPPVARTND